MILIVAARRQRHALDPSRLVACKSGRVLIRELVLLPVGQGEGGRQAGRAGIFHNARTPEIGLHTEALQIQCDHSVGIAAVQIVVLGGRAAVITRSAVWFAVSFQSVSV